MGMRSADIARRQSGLRLRGRLLRRCAVRAAGLVLLAFAGGSLQCAQAQMGTSTPPTATVPADWELKPEGVGAGAGERFRLLFVTSTTRNAESNNIDDYNDFVVGRAEAGHDEIDVYASGFRVVGSTGNTDARDNIAYRNSNVPVYWLDGPKVADDSDAFYDGSWDNEGHPTNEDGEGVDAQGGLPVWTGSEDDGTRYDAGGTDAYFGLSRVSYGNLNSSDGPLESGTATRSRTYRFYALSQEFRVSASLFPNHPATGRPVISGAAEVGATLTALTGTIMDEDGLGNPNYRYQWIRLVDGRERDIAGARWATYRLEDEDEDKRVKVRVSFTDDQGYSEARTSDAFPSKGTIKVPNNPATGKPVISGEAEVGETLTAATGTIRDEDGLGDPPNYRYQWIRLEDGHESDIAGARSATYRLALEDGHHRVKVRVSLYDDRGYQEARTSDPYPSQGTIVSPPNLAPTGRPGIGGAVRGLSVGGLLAAQTVGPPGAIGRGLPQILDPNGTENAAQDQSWLYQWIRVDGENETDIPGATDKYYWITHRDEGKRLRVRVTYTDDDGYVESLVSRAVPREGTILAGDPPHNAPARGLRIEGSAAQVGELVIAHDVDITDDNGVKRATYRFQWFRVDGNRETAITPLVLSPDNYRLTDEDIGKRVKVRVHFTDDHGYSEVLESALYPANGTVTAAPPPAPPEDPQFTASLSGPQVHDWKTPFTVRLTFSASLKESSQLLLPRLILRVGGGRLTDTDKVNGRTWDLTILPTGLGIVRVSLDSGSRCDNSTACSVDRVPLSEDVSLTVQAPNLVLVDDAQAQEGSPMEFRVRLNYAALTPLTVDYATEDVTAVAGDDYTARSGTLRFAPGQRYQTVSVPTSDDGHDDGGETFRLRLSGVSDAHGARIALGTATGTINNTDHMPQAWLARFGRTASDHVIAAIGQRFGGDAGAPPGSHLTVGGYACPTGGGVWAR